MAIFSEAQRAGLGELRRRQTHAEAHDLTPAQRIELASTMMRGLPAPSIPGRERATDEPPELWLRLAAHFRECGAK
jgi:hypothetical protein